MAYLLEIATADFITTQSAVAGGADRIELCAALGDGGTTPSLGTIRQCRESFSLPLFPIIRPRGGDFLYTDEEYNIMLTDVKLCRDLGCDGVVLGLLQSDGRIDIKRTEALVKAAYPMEVTFHRAFDRCVDPFEALEKLVEAGVQRILTSGQKPTAPEGAGLIAELVKAASERIIIMPGSGVRTDNIVALAKETGATEFHTSLRAKQSSHMQYRHPSFADADFQNPAIHASDVESVKKLLDENQGEEKSTE
ncbi:MAG: copper homeostasis protein CutC [Flavisolibacter sp.]